MDRQLDLRVLDGEATVSELGFEPQHGEDVNLGGREWLSTWYMRTFPHNDRPALSIQGSRFERPLRRLWTESWWDLGLAGLVAKGRPCSSRERRLGHCFRPSDGILRGRGGGASSGPAA